MKKFILAICLFAMVAFAGQQISQALRIDVPDVSTSGLTIVGTTNQVAPYLNVKNETGTIYSIGANGAVNVAATTNQIQFGGTNTAPANLTNIVKWISVKVGAETNAYRLPLYQ